MPGTKLILSEHAKHHSLLYTHTHYSHTHTNTDIHTHTQHGLLDFPRVPCSFYFIPLEFYIYLHSLSLSRLYTWPPRRPVCTEISVRETATYRLLLTSTRRQDSRTRYSQTSNGPTFITFIPVGQSQLVRRSRAGLLKWSSHAAPQSFRLEQ